MRHFSLSSTWNHFFAALGLFWLGLSAVGTRPAHASPGDLPVLWNARFSGLKADLSCGANERDCNRCASNVEAQFRALTQQNTEYRRKSWTWRRRPDNGGHGYAPEDLSPTDVFKVFPGGLNSDGWHFQGFVRLADKPGSNGLSLFASYGGNDAAIFAMKAATDLGGQIHSGELNYVESAFTVHPGGMTGLGRYLMIAHDDAKDGDAGAAPAYVEIIDADKMPDAQASHIWKLDNNRSQSVGATRLASGGYLIAVGLRMNDFALYYTSSLTDLQFERIDARTVHADKALILSGDMAGYENITLVNECGTGDIYMIGASGDGAYVSNDGVWALHKLVATGGDGPYFQRITTSTRDLYDYGCDERASGTAFVGEDGKLSLYCHQKSQDPDARKEAGICGAGVAFFDVIASVLGGAPVFDPISGAICADALAADTNVVFTEISKFKTIHQYTVNITARSDVGIRQSFGLRDTNLGLDCVKPEKKRSVSCTWQVYEDTLINFEPYYMPGSNIRPVWVEDAFGPGSIPAGTDMPWQGISSESAILTLEEQG